ncbi:MAG: twin-arginine translocase TatA/TatE family subunit [Actinomycetota bacterium]|nr:twin-arginine translocase TatA/TatE family subunit [Actinomycetota bacterium]
MGRIGAPELLIILVVVLLLFGAAKLPSLARSLGASAKEFRKGVDEGVGDGEQVDDEQEDVDAS